MYLTCHEVRFRVDDYAGQTLPAQEALSVRAHLNGCAACRGHLAQAQRLRALVREAGLIVPPPGYLETLPSRCFGHVQRKAQRRHPAGWFAQSSIGIALAATLAAVLMVGRTTPDFSETASPTKPVVMAGPELDWSSLWRGLAGPRPVAEPTPHALTASDSKEGVVWVSLISTESATPPKNYAVPMESVAPSAMSPAREPDASDEWIARATLNPQDHRLQERETRLVSTWGESPVRLSRQGSAGSRQEEGVYGLAGLVRESGAPTTQVTFPVEPIRQKRR